MRRNYGSILPKDILLNLGLYLNYRDIWNLCQLNANICFTPDLWIYKIQKELQYSADFVKQYVYNITSKQKITRLPLNEKYMELKSRNNVDFGSEYYKTLPVLLHRASRKRDFEYARQLIKYFLASTITLTYVDEIIVGAVSVGNLELMYDIIERMTGHRQPPVETDEFRPIIVDSIIEGYYQSSMKTKEKMPSLLSDFHITPELLKTKQVPIIKGLAAGNHLEELKRQNIDLNDITLRLQLEHAAVQNNAYSVINYYQIKRPVDIAMVVDYVGIDAMADIALVPVESLVENSYLEYLILDKKKLAAFLEKLQRSPLASATLAYATLLRTIQNNHVDMLAYFVNVLNVKFPPNVQKKITENIDTLLPETYEYLKKNVIPGLTVES